ncbi:hypothetical protein [Maricaulis sp.]|uniref:PBECR3 domain-containing polyvalent protein n=1 Tax=Maricaulis sp. TaxID=1486257 RepID=UPI002B27216A|nr:hypothetical protein [Maricaulis sp.]
MNYKARRIGLLKTKRINQTLGTELEDADLWVSKAAHRHIALDHPNDYLTVLPNLSRVIEDPAYVGQKPGQADNFYLFRKIHDKDRAVLIAIGIRRNRYGTYNLRSAYAISDANIQRYRMAGHLRIL